jgi:hypothetical protein
MGDMRNEISFQEYLDYLRDSIQFLAVYWQKIGHKNPYIKDIHMGLRHSDPFIIHKASIAASLLLNDRRIYH